MISCAVLDSLTLTSGLLAPPPSSSHTHVNTTSLPTTPPALRPRPHLLHHQTPTTLPARLQGWSHTEPRPLPPVRWAPPPPQPPGEQIFSHVLHGLFRPGLLMNLCSSCTGGKRRRSAPEEPSAGGEAPCGEGDGNHPGSSGNAGGLGLNQHLAWDPFKAERWCTLFSSSFQTL